jgi:hypothetical protein
MRRHAHTIATLTAAIARFNSIRQKRPQIHVQATSLECLRLGQTDIQHYRYYA